MPIHAPVAPPSRMHVFWKCVQWIRDIRMTHSSGGITVEALQAMEPQLLDMLEEWRKDLRVAPPDPHTPQTDWDEFHALVSELNTADHNPDNVFILGDTVVFQVELLDDAYVTQNFVDGPPTPPNLGILSSPATAKRTEAEGPMGKRPLPRSPPTRVGQSRSLDNSGKTPSSPIRPPPSKRPRRGTSSGKSQAEDVSAEATPVQRISTRSRTGDLPVPAVQLPTESDWADADWVDDDEGEEAPKRHKGVVAKRQDEIVTVRYPGDALYRCLTCGLW